ncbi:MAG TPA: flagellar basal-body rod protein FlgG [Polyangiaceae bacterium]|nr:flagellar basal-body rod protein FlgG [Polyangiaceae bacterium]
MFRALHVAATGMAAQETNLEGISNNISNANTVGYKKQRIDFQDLLYQQVRAPGAPTSATTMLPTGLQLGSGVRVSGTSRQFGQGTLTQTKNQLDVAIEGNGFFVVQQADGTLAYTRAGTLQTDGTGRLVNGEGLPLDPPLSIPSNTISVSIAATGKVTAQVSGEQNPIELGNISLATFVNPAGLRALGHNLFMPTPASGEAMVGNPGEEGRGALMQGAIEQANVDIVEEMIGLISAQRAYEINSKVITTADQMLEAATQIR